MKRRNSPGRPYTLHELETTAYTTVVVEIVERNLGNLLRQAPIMPAPQRDPEETGAAAEADAVDNAVKQVLRDGFRTVDIMSEDCLKAGGRQVGCQEMGTLLADRI